MPVSISSSSMSGLVGGPSGVKETSFSKNHLTRISAKPQDNSTPVCIISLAMLIFVRKFAQYFNQKDICCTYE